MLAGRRILVTGGNSGIDATSCVFAWSGTGITVGLGAAVAAGRLVLAVLAVTRAGAWRDVKLIKDAKLKKVQASIQGDFVRVSGRDRDVLQAAIKLLRETDFGIDMQFTNYRTN